MLCIVKNACPPKRLAVYDLMSQNEHTTVVNFFQIKMLMDIKKIYHRDAERDEGWYEFDVTPAVQRWILRHPKNFQVTSISS